LIKWRRIARGCALSDNCEVGYKKPPQSTRFKKGRSGNPKGRPKNAKNTTPTELLDQYLSTQVTVAENGEKKTMTLLEALQRRLVTAALKGEPYAMRLVQKELQKIDRLRDKDIRDGEGDDRQRIIVEFV
jgi:hypothetical protein